MFLVKLAFKLFLPKRRQLSFALSLACLCMGVACLVATNAVVSGFDTTLKSSIIDVTGDVFVTTRVAYRESWDEMWDRIRPTITATLPHAVTANDQIQAIPFILNQAIATKKGQLAGIVVQGVARTDSVINLQSRLLEGRVDIGSVMEPPYSALIGRGLAENFDLKVGEELMIVFPLTNDINPNRFRRKLGRFKIEAILDLGKHSYDERYVLTDMQVLQDLLEVGDAYSGLMIKIPDSDYAGLVSDRINIEYLGEYSSRDWFATNRTLFQAINIEKKVIFLVVSIILIMAAFILASTLFINVVQRYRDVSVLKAMGLSRKRVLLLFLYQGLFVGVISVIGGLLLGLGLSWMFEDVLLSLFDFPGDVYKLNALKVDIRFFDVLQTAAFTLFVCFVSTLAPAIAGSRISIQEGLRYE